MITITALAMSRHLVAQMGTNGKAQTVHQLGQQGHGGPMPAANESKAQQIRPRPGVLPRDGEGRGI